MTSYKQFPRFKKYLGKNILSIDYGTKVTGLATFTPGKIPYPCPFDKIIYKNDDDLVIQILKICQSEFIEVVVIGIPKLLDGGETNMTKKIKDFSLLLESKLAKDNIELHQQDETLSTFEAKERMKNSPQYNFKIDLKKIDALAASIILEDFMKSEL